MADIKLEVASEAALAEANRWASFDSATPRLFKTHEHGNTIVPKAGVQYWVAKLADRSVGFVSLSTDQQHHAQLDFIVRHDERRQGIGEKIVQKILVQPELKAVTRVIAAVKMGNTAGEKVLRANGFHHAGFDEQGDIKFEKKL